MSEPRGSVGARLRGMETPLGGLLASFVWAGSRLADYHDRWALFFAPEGLSYSLFSHSSLQPLSRRVAEAGVERQ